MSVYDIAAYGSMVADPVRFDAYREALRQVVRDGDTVLDLGTGTGLHAMLACRAGAGKVYAIEPSEAIQVAREIARDNGFDDRITFIQQPSERVSLPSRADVIVSDLRGVLPLFGRHVPSIVDARQRLLREGGALIPCRDEIWAAPVEAPDVYHELIESWDNGRAGLRMGAARQFVTQTLHRRRVSEDQLLTEPQSWASLEYREVEKPGVSSNLRFRLQKDGTVHGISCWFDSELAHGIRISNGPGRPETVYGMAFLPLLEPAVVSSGDSVEADISARLVGTDYVWSWNTRIRNGDGDEIAAFRQSTFHGTILAADSLRLADTNAAPALSPRGLVDLDALRMIDGDTPTKAIAAHLHETYAQTFPTTDDALAHVMALLRRYAEP